MTRPILGVAVSMALFAVGILFAAGSASAGVASLDEALGERVLGKLDAPVTIYEYSSLSCPHCATFHAETLSKIKKNYINTGKVNLVLRDFPLGGAAMAAAMIARCSGEQKYFGFIEMLFRSQGQWASAQKPIEELKKIARFGGMMPADVDSCLTNKKLFEALKQRMRDYQIKYDIEATPTFLVGKVRISGASGYEHFKKVLDDALSEAK